MDPPSATEKVSGAYRPAEAADVTLIYHFAGSHVIFATQELSADS